MRATIALMGLVLLAANTNGCNPKPTPVAGSVTAIKVDGTVTSVQVTFPHIETGQHEDYGPMTFTGREEIDALVKNIEAIIVDLKAAQSEMKAIEPPVVPTKK